MTEAQVIKLKEQKQELMEKLLIINGRIRALEKDKEAIKRQIFDVMDKLEI